RLQSAITSADKRQVKNVSLGQLLCCARLPREVNCSSLAAQRSRKEKRFGAKQRPAFLIVLLYRYGGAGATAPIIQYAAFSDGR
ncbi:hypothetical protein, partial [Mesorhizobium sp. M7A.F.Ca.CA.002.04.1.1]|uniref:hypothetical protein n=1 Tax=Mesorhizobium sp. M7A.F.Ca.CA.002.04.1.1 TaxID=2496681 RepID=UPI0019D49F78